MVDHSLQNAYGTLHGGCTATLVDVLGTMALLTKEAEAPGGPQGVFKESPKKPN